MQGPDSSIEPEFRAMLTSPSTATRSRPPRVCVASWCIQWPISGAGTTTSVAGDRYTLVAGMAGPVVSLVSCNC